MDYCPDGGNLKFFTDLPKYFVENNGTVPSIGQVLL